MLETEFRLPLSRSRSVMLLMDVTEERFCWLVKVRLRLSHAGLSVRLSMLAVGDELPVSLTSEPGDEARGGLGGPSMLTGRLRGGRCGSWSSRTGAIDSWAGCLRRDVVGRDSSA